MNIKYYIQKADGLTLPKKANVTDAGYDIIATSDPVIVGKKGDGDAGYDSIDYVQYHTGLHFIPEANYLYTDLRPRSSISSKTNFVLANSMGLIDSGYYDEVLVRFRYIWQPEDMWWGTISIDDANIRKTMFGMPNTEKMYKKGDKIAQLVSNVGSEIEFVLVDNLTELAPGKTASNRGGGFGSSDRKSALADMYEKRLKQQNEQKQPTL
jgi:dUTPase